MYHDLHKYTLKKKKTEECMGEDIKISFDFDDSRAFEAEVSPLKN